MKKLNISILGFFIFLLYVLHFQARDDEDRHLANFLAWPTHQGNPVACFQASFYHDQSSLQQDPYNFITPQNSGFLSCSSRLDWYQQHRQFVLSRIVGVVLQGKMIRITPEDIQLINRICADNLHKNQDELRKQLAASSAFNYAQHFLKGDNLLDAFTSDIFIDAAHFKQLFASDYRIKRLMDAAKDAIEDRYEIEKSKLKANSKITSKNRKKLKTDLDAEYKRQKKHPLGIKQLRKPIVTASQSQTQVIQQAQPQQANKKSNISSQEIQKLSEHNNNQVLRISGNQDNSFQQVMDKRSKAFEISVKNQTPTTKQITINSQTAGFLQSQNIDLDQFQQIEGLPIQHQLTHELVDVLDAVADYAQQHHYEIYKEHLIKYCAHFASLSQEFKLSGFHHDEYSVLEKSGSVQWKNKIHGKVEFGAEECFMADSDWGDGIICRAKTFFPSSWSREKTVQVIFEAAQNRIEDISEPHQKNQKKYLCKGPNNMLIEMVINSKNIIISAYPSKKNFRI